MTNTKRLGRYHDVPNNNSNDKSNLQPHFSELESLHKDNSRMASIDFNKPLFGNKHTSLQRLLANANKTTERATKFLNKMKLKQIAYANRSKSIPENATIRKEYIKCGKEFCELKHGPYYYAYWKDPESKKLKKKYIGDHVSKDKEPSNDYGNDINTL
ncbi:MAG TPA: hypothetical protein VJ729_07790 [Nitrososphaeraceae archaeon]|nr:hypothetical protein [Nitrososphaeraceae archaeon]